MKKTSKRYIKLASAILLIATIGFLLQPIYLVIAEFKPQLRGPWGWLEIPDVAPFTEVLLNPAYREAADQARELLVQHRRELQLPALSAAVAVDGQLVWAGTVGWEDLGELRPATPQTVFRVGSVSKAITATVLARMVDSGQVDLDAPIVQYLSPLPNPDWEPMTLRQLASHTSGITDYENNRDWPGLYRTLALKQHHADVKQGLEYFDDTPVLGPPGTLYLYSSYGTSLLSAVVQSVAEVPFADLVRQHVNLPLGVATPLAAPIAHHNATFYQLHQGRARPWWNVNLSHRLAGGGFYGTPADLVLVGSAWLEPDYISATTRETFWTHQLLVDGSRNPDDYAIGWRVGERLWWSKEEIPFFHANHGGVSKGSMSWLIVIPEERIAIALAINTNITPFSRWANLYLPLFKAFAHSDPEPIADQ